MLSSLFANPWVLGTLAAALLPLIIEWLFKRRKQQIELPTLKFLLENEEQEQIKKQDRLLLILRTIAVLALVLPWPISRRSNSMQSTPRLTS